MAAAGRAAREAGAVKTAWMVRTPTIATTSTTPNRSKRAALNEISRLAGIVGFSSYSGEVANRRQQA